jgi:hypothetical protein
MRRSLLKLIFVLAGVAIYLAPARAASPRDDKDRTVKLDSFRSKAPADWVEEPSTSRMRLKQFKLPGGAGQEPAELTIYFFGKGSGGSAEDNVKRWRAMFTSADGKKSADLGKVEKFKVGDVDITYLDVHGTYLTKVPPFAPNAKTVATPGQRMLAVVFESKDGPYFLRLVGPAATVEKQKKSFDEWLKAFKE